MCCLRAERRQVSQDLLRVVEGCLDAVVDGTAGEYFESQDESCREDQSSTSAVSMSRDTCVYNTDYSL